MARGNSANSRASLDELMGTYEQRSRNVLMGRVDIEGRTPEGGTVVVAVNARDLDDVRSDVELTLVQDAVSAEYSLTAPGISLPVMDSDDAPSIVLEMGRGISESTYVKNGVPSRGDGPAEVVSLVADDTYEKAFSSLQVKVGEVYEYRDAEFKLRTGRLLSIGKLESVMGSVMGPGDEEVVVSNGQLIADFIECGEVSIITRKETFAVDGILKNPDPDIPYTSFTYADNGRGGEYLFMKTIQTESEGFLPGSRNDDGRPTLVVNFASGRPRQEQWYTEAGHSHREGAPALVAYHDLESWSPAVEAWYKDNSLTPMEPGSDVCARGYDHDGLVTHSISRESNDGETRYKLGYFGFSATGEWAIEKTDYFMSGHEAYRALADVAAP